MHGTNWINLPPSEYWNDQYSYQGNGNKIEWLLDYYDMRLYIYVSFDIVKDISGAFYVDNNALVFKLWPDVDNSKISQTYQIDLNTATTQIEKYLDNFRIIAENGLGSIKTVSF